MAVVLRSPPETQLVLPPGFLPHHALAEMVGAYRRGEVSARELTAAVDREGTLLEVAIERAVTRDVEDFNCTVRRLQLVIHHIETDLAQQAWLKRFPDGGAVELGPLTVRVGQRQVEVRRMLAMLGALDPSVIALAPGGHG